MSPVYSGDLIVIVSGWLGKRVVSCGTECIAVPLITEGTDVSDDTTSNDDTTFMSQAGTKIQKPRLNFQKLEAHNSEI